jgi:hypothetical protein
MANLGEETRDFCSIHAVTLIAGHIILGPEFWDGDAKQFVPKGREVKLRQKDSVDKFFSELYKIDYDSGFGHQEVFGQLWFSDGSVAIRDEYDGAEKWMLVKTAVPDDLM